MTGFLGRILDFLNPVRDIIDEVVTSDEERLALKIKMAEIEASLTTAALDADRELAKARGEVIAAEAKSEHPITAMWRPITMLSFVVLLFLIAFGWVKADVLAAVPSDLWDIIKLGLTGYVVGRSVEKATRNYADGRREDG